MNAYLAVSSFLVSSVTFFFLIAVSLKGVGKKKNLTFCFFAVSVIIWSLGHMYWLLADSEKEAIFWIRILVVGSSLIPYAYLHFVTHFVGRLMPRLVGFGYLLGALMSVLAWTPCIFKGVESRMGFEYWPIAGPCFSVYFGGFALAVLFCYVLLFEQYLKASVKVRNQSRYLIIGTAIGFLGGGTNFPLWLDIQIPPLLHGLSIFYILGIGYSVLKYRLLDFNEMAIRIFGFAIISITIGGLAACVSFWMMGYAYPEFYPKSFAPWWTLFTLLCFSFLIISPHLHNFVNILIQEKLISARFAYRGALKIFSDQIIADIQSDDTPQSLVANVHEIMGLDYAAIYIRTGLETTFECLAVEGVRPSRGDMDSASIDPMIQFLYSKRRALFLDEQSERSSEFKRKMQPVLENHPQIRVTDLIIPVSAQGSFYGFMVLGASSLYGAFADVDLLILENLCTQYALALKSREVERIANRSEKLISLGTMAAGLSHELRNPLVSVRTLAGLLNKEESGSLELKPKFRQTIQRDVKRITGIVEGISAFARDAKRPMMHVTLPDALEEARAALDDKLELCSIRVDIEIEEGVPCALGNFEQLIQVFQNIFENGINAIAEWEGRPDLGIIAVHVYSRGGGRTEQKRWVEVKISDNGPGMCLEFQSRIFDPFVTSRDTGMRQGASGTGLGLAIVNKIMEQHQGSITVESSKGKGATFRISIPSV